MHKPKVEILHKVRPKLAELEQQRRKMLEARQNAETIAITLVIVGIVLALSLGSYLGEENGMPVVIMIPILTLAIAVYYIRTTRMKEQGNLQQDIGNVITDAMGSDWSYAAERHLSPGLVKYSGLMGKNRTIYGSNLMRGKHGDTRFSFSNIKISGNENDNSEVFGGLILAIDFHKKLKGKTLVFPDLAQNMLGSWLGKKVQSFGWNGLELVYLEDPDFEKAFAVYGADQVEARYILTPNMMSNMLSLKTKYGDHFSFSFTQGTVFVAIENVNPFESSLSAPILPDGTFYHFYKAIDLVTEVIDTLQLNTRIWSK